MANARCHWGRFLAGWESTVPRSTRSRTGSTFGIAAFFPLENVTATGKIKNFTRPSDSGYPVTFHFCPDCGATVFWQPQRKPEAVAVAVGAFADPSFPAPGKSVYGQHRHPW